MKTLTAAMTVEKQTRPAHKTWKQIQGFLLRV